VDFLVTGFIYWIFNLLCPKDEPIKYTNNSETRQSHYENGAAFFFSTSPLHGDQNDAPQQPPINEDYDNGPEW